MGKDYIPVKRNNLDLRKAYHELTREGTKTVKEASERKYFFMFPEFKDIEEIEVGSSGTKESILVLKDGGFVGVNKTIDSKKLAKREFS